MVFATYTLISQAAERKTVPMTVDIPRVDAAMVETEIVSIDATRMWPRRPIITTVAGEPQPTATDINVAPAHKNSEPNLEKLKVFMSRLLLRRIRSYDEDERRDPVTTGVADAP